MTQHEAPHMIPTAQLLNTNHGSTQSQPDLVSDGGTAIERGDVGYIQDGTFVKLFNPSKGIGHLITGDDPCFADGTSSIPLIGIASSIAGAGGMKITAGQHIDNFKQQDTTFGNIASGKGVIQENSFAEYLQKNNESWLTFAAKLGHHAPPSGLVFVTRCDQALACAASVDSASSAELEFFVSTGGDTKESAGFLEGWESADSYTMNSGVQSPESFRPRSILSYAMSLLHGTATSIFNYALQWPSDQQRSSHSQHFTEDKSSWLYPKLLIQSTKSPIYTSSNISTGLNEREDSVVNFEQAQLSGGEKGCPSSGSGTHATLRDDTTLCSPRSVEDSDPDDELVEILQTYQAQHEGLPAEELIRFIFKNSTAERALVHDDDFISLFQNNPKKGTYGFRSWIHNLRPQIYIDQNVGMVENTHNLQMCSSVASADLSLLDITEFIQMDSPHPIDCGPAWDIFGATCNVLDTSTGQEDDLNVAIRVLAGPSDQKEEIDQRLRPELARWHHLKHPNVAGLLGVARLHPERPLGSVTKRSENPNLLAYIGMHLELKLEKAKEIVDGIQYLHDQGVIHGDLKVDNVIIADDGQAQISDFGIAQVLDASSFMTLTQNNSRFTAPELIPVTENGVSDVRPTRESDIFSLGMLLLQMKCLREVSHIIIFRLALVMILGW